MDRYPRNPSPSKGLRYTDNAENHPRHAGSKQPYMDNLSQRVPYNASPRTVLQPLESKSPHHLDVSPNGSQRNSIHFGRGEDASLMRSSSTAHFRHLSTYGSPSPDNNNFVIPGVTDINEDVTGLHGRVRLARNESAASHVASRNWMDKQRKNIQAYEYLCHIGEAKEWIEACIGEEIPEVIKLEERLRDGVVLAKLTRVFAPHLVRRIFEHPKLQFRHSENINYFFQFLYEIGIPDLFMFELTDLYDKKNIPKVIYCVHALGYMLSSEGLAPPIGNLVGKLEFTEDEIRTTQKGLDSAGINVPNFRGMNKHFNVPEPEPEPEISEEEQMAIELAEAEPEIEQFQAACRGALLRFFLKADLYVLQHTSDQVTILQSHFRGARLRQRMAQNKQIQQMHDWTRLQAICRGALARRRLRNYQREIAKLNSAKSFVVALQSTVRGIQTRNALKGHVRSIYSNSNTLCGLQAVARGALVRNRIDRLKYYLETTAIEIEQLQATVRGKRARALMAGSTQRMNAFDWSHVQALCRGFLFRQKVKGLKQVLSYEMESIVGFQALVRALPVRQEAQRKQRALQNLMPFFLELQSIIRAGNVRADLTADHDVLYSYEYEFTALQAKIRGNAVRKQIDSELDEMYDNEKRIIKLQSWCRGELERQRLQQMRSAIWDCDEEIVPFQAACRGVLIRNDYDETRVSLIGHESFILDLQSVYRASVVRSAIAADLDKLDLFTPRIVRLQSVFRGLLARFDYDLLMEEFDEAMDSIVDMQSVVRGHLVRKAFNDRMQHFKNNLDKVIKIQSFVRAKKQGDAYKSLITGSNPPLSTVKSFVHLLNDSDLDFEQEVELEQSRKKVIDEVRNNEMLEQFITQLDVKIALLLKNKITLDEVIKHRNKGVKAQMSVGSDMFDLKALNKASRRRLELYQGFFYVLQTQPVYFTRLFRKLRDNVISEKEIKDIEGLVMTVFGYAQKRREEYFLLQLISSSVKDEMQHLEKTRGFLRGNFIWWKLVAAINRNTKERKFLKELLGSSVALVVENPDMDLESNPLAIHRSLINNEELRTGRLSHRDPNLPVDEAIQDPDTRATFIANLQQLRELSSHFLTALEKNVEALPYHIRYLAKVSFAAAKEQFVNEPEDRLLAVIGHVIFGHYLNPAIISADNYGIVKNALAPLQTKNLTEVTKMLSQIASLKLFSKENVYLQPLNDYVKMNIPRMRQLFMQIISIAEPEQEYDMNVFDDLTSHRRPTLFIKTNDIFGIHSLVSKELDSIAPDFEDSLRNVIRELGALPNDASEILNIARFTEVKLDLNPSFCKVEDVDAEMNSVLVAAKRYLLYVLRVQNGDNLMDVLLAPVSPEFEEKYKAILKEEQMDRKKQKPLAYSESSLGDLSRITYRDLKRLALEKVLELEAMGRISREDSYQELLNSIAIDIKTKRNRRVARQKELENIQQTLIHLAEKETYLQTQLKTYNDYIEQAMSTLQNKKGRKRNLVLPFTRQYFHMRDLQKHGKVPKFGSYKYTARNLFDKGVIVELNGYPESQYSQVSFTFSSDEVGMFNIEAAFGSIALPGATVELTLDDLLGHQYNNLQYFSLFEDMAKFNTNLTLHFIFKKFYES
ncbi:hypothetical protein TRVA0_008S02036 [Trichomonascus vanleenenianus]|uniref:Iqg1p n=1 Tax=Trichomonascus vanleenenianus TaxID=2268995 RepID=UPI003ECAB6A4